MKLKHKDIMTYKVKLLEEQGFICPITKEILTATTSVLDHCHKSGHCRAALSNKANRLEGKVLNSLVRFGFKPDEYVQALEGLLEYWREDFTTNALHPKHKTPEEKEINKLKKYLKTLKTPAARARCQLKIDNLL